jgi:hypothetical protein
VNMESVRGWVEVWSRTRRRMHILEDINVSEMSQGVTAELRIVQLYA